MRTSVLFLAAIGAVGQATAQTFAEQVASAKAEAAKPEGQQYEQALFPAIGRAMRTCVPPGITDQAKLGNFTLVGRVNASGALRNSLVEPMTAVSQCFRARLNETQLPPPPYVLSSPGGAGFPVVVEIKVTP